MRKFSILFSALMLVASIAPAAPALPFVESFDYTAGNLVGTAPDWLAHSGAATNPIQVVGSSLTYAGLPASIGGKATAAVATGTREDANLVYTLTVPADGEFLYAAAIIQVASSTGAGDYIMHFMDGATTNFRGRLYVRPLGAGFQFGISYATSTVTYDATERAFGTPHLVVMRLNKLAGQDNVSIIINPTLPGTEPAVNVTSGDAGSDLTLFNAVAIRQGSTGTASFEVDEVRVARTYADVTTTTVQVPVELSGFSLD